MALIHRLPRPPPWMLLLSRVLPMLSVWPIASCRYPPHHCMGAHTAYNLCHSPVFRLQTQEAMPSLTGTASSALLSRVRTLIRGFHGVGVSRRAMAGGRWQMATSGHVDLTHV